MSVQTYPLDNNDYTADDAALFHSTRTTGIYANDDFGISVTGADNNVTISPGLAWMRISRFKGMVVAMKLDEILEMGLPDSVYPRIDRIALQYDANSNNTQLVAIMGVPSSNPVPPPRSTTEAKYEIHLFEVRRDPGDVSITYKNVKDLRLDPANCGLMADSVTNVDTSAINAQVNALIEELRQAIQGVKDNTAFVMKSGDTMTGPLNLPPPVQPENAANKEYVDSRRKTFTATISTSWTGSAAPYTQTVTVAGIFATDMPHITPVYSSTLATAQAQAEAWGAVSMGEAVADGIKFTCFDDKPATAINIQIEVMR